ncbi:MAG: TonB-dependent receptor [Gemmatirosa sp.]|nr:TonB-dependent receptor [Gemmatirosa sp.]
MRLSPAPRQWPTLAIALLLGPALARTAAAQAGAIRGTVTDSASQRPVVGAQVTLLGVPGGAVTNDVGVYMLRNVAPGSATVRVQRLGYAEQSRAVTVSAGATASADFVIRPIATVLSTVVSVGYGTASRQNVTSAIASVDSTAIRNAPVAAIDNALQGKIAGVQVVQNSGEPGSGVSVRVRGPASMNAGNQPLYVVDGIPIIQGTFTQTGQSGQDQNAVSALNPDEIASIDVLKDAAAAAIYGSRGSNGVILITTKRGTAGKTRFTFNAYGGTQKVERQIGLLDAQQYVSLMNESAKNDGYDVSDYDFVAGVDDSASFNWQNAVFRNAPVSDASLSVSGGSERFRFLVSGANFDQRGIVIGSSYQRQAGRLNLDVNATRRLIVQTSLGLTRENDARVPGDQSLYGVVTNAIGLQPMRPVFGNSFGYGGTGEGLKYANPVAIAAYNQNSYKTLRALGHAEAKYTVVDGLTLTGRAGADIFGVDELQWASPKVDGTSAASLNGYGQSGHSTVNRYISEGFFTAEPLRSSTQNLSITGGSSVEYNRRDLNYVLGQGFPTGFTTYVRNATTVTSWDGSRTENNLVSFFSRASYTLLDRYLVGASFRADGSSRFGKSNRYGYFPAASLGWIVTDEPALQRLARIGTLKLRGSYGRTGNQGIGDYASLNLAAGAPYAGTPGVAATQLGNPSLKWESTSETDVGADIGFFHERVGITADWYNRKTSDLLVQRPIPVTSGYASIWDNIGTIRNRGLDLALHTVNVDAGAQRGFGWTSDLNVTWNRNRVDSLYKNQPVTFTVSSRVTSIAAVGQPLGEFYLYKALRVDPQTGNVVFQCVVNPAVPACKATAGGFGETGAPVAADLTYVGSPQPNYYGGFTNTLSYKGFDLRSFLQFSQGNEIFNMMRIFTDDGGYSYDNKSTVTLNRWQKPGDVTDEPRMSYDGTSGARLASSRMVEDGSFLRLGEVTLGYALPTRLVGRTGLDNARVYVSGRNLKTWTKYTGYNPDVSSSGSTANVVTGVDYYAYPLARTVSLGLSAGW